MPTTTTIPASRRCLARLLPGLAAFCLLGAARGADLEIVLSEATPVYAEAAEAVRKEIASQHSVVVSGVERRAGAAGRVTVALGTRALQAVVSAPGGPVIAALVTRHAYERALAGRERQAATAVFIEQPYARQLNLARALLPGKSRMGVLYGREWERDLPELEAAAREQKLALVREPVAAASELHAALTRVLAESDLLLALPEPALFNSGTLTNILLTAYRLQRPVLGFSAAYVRAGALGAVYSTPAQLGRQAGEIAAQVLAGASLPKPHGPHYFSVSVNATVARSLELRVDEESVVTLRLQRMEREP